MRASRPRFRIVATRPPPSTSTNRRSATIPSIPISTSSTAARRTDLIGDTWIARTVVIARSRLPSAGSQGDPMPDNRFVKALNEQIAYEFGASQQYAAVAVYYDAETLPRLAAHFYRQSLEERNHAMMMVQYLLDAGEDVMIPNVKKPRTTFNDTIKPIT